jgi:hypothetical protein
VGKTAGGIEMLGKGGAAEQDPQAAAGVGLPAQAQHDALN